ncbi:MAG: hypothetical protein KJO44_00475 [Gemmatimonadetes bacterium]|nr:hypothetical protein [Gemmatimonadota bacterium]
MRARRRWAVGHRRARPSVLVSVLACGVFALAGCAVVGSGSDGRTANDGPAPSIAGEWTGLLSLDDASMSADLRLRQSGGDLEGVLEARFDEGGTSLVATGDGRIRSDGVVFLTLSYDLRCAGRLELEGRRSSDGFVIDGTVSARDCTGGSEGSFSFRR